MTVYCANDPCESEARFRTEKGTPLCWCCAEAYGWGMASPDGSVTSIEEGEEDGPETEGDAQEDDPAGP